MTDGMTASAEIRIASAGPECASEAALGLARGLGCIAGSKTTPLKQSKDGEQGFNSRLRMLIASADTREAGAGAAEIPASASTATAQMQRMTTVEATAHHHNNQPISVSSQQTQIRVAEGTNIALLHRADAQQPVPASRSSAQIPGPPEANAFQAGNLETAKEMRTAHRHKDAKSNPRTAMHVPATLQPSVLAAIPVPTPAQPLQAHTSSWRGAEPVAGPAAHSSHRTLHILPVGAEAVVLADAGNVPAAVAKPSAPSLAKSVSVPAFDQAVRSRLISSDMQSSDARTEPPAETGMQLATRDGARLSVHHFPQPAVREAAANLAASDISLSIPRSSAADSAVPAGADEKAASAGNSAAAKSTEFNLRPNTSHAHAAQSAHPAGSEPIGIAPMQATAMAAHDPSATNTAGMVKGGSESSTGATAATAEASAVRETFASLDAAVSTSAPTWIHASPHQAEAGFKDPALGWVAVRAQTDTNGIHATLVPGSADAALSLSTHLAGLHAHLAEHQTPVATLTLAAQDSHWAGSGMSQSGGQNAGQGEHSEQQADVRSSASAIAPSVISHSAMTTDRNDTGSAEMMPGGAYISVMA